MHMVNEGSDMTVDIGEVLASEVVNHVGIYGYKEAKSFSAFNLVLVKGR